MQPENQGDEDDDARTNLEGADSEPIHSAPKPGHPQSQTSQTLRTSNRYKNFWKTRRSVSDVFGEDTAKNGKENSDPTTDKAEPKPTMSSPNANSRVKSTQESPASSASSLSLYSESEKLMGVEMPRLSAAHDLLDTGSSSRPGNSAISRLFYKIISSSSTNSGKTKDKRSVNSHKLMSPYIGNELNDQICECYERVENMDRKKPSYMTGSLMIHCKAMKKLFNENMRSRIIKRQSDHQLCLENWKLAISSMEIFIDGLEKQLNMALLDSPCFDENDRPRVSHNEKNREEADRTIKSVGVDDKVPEKYKIPLRKDLYSYDKIESEFKKDDLDHFLDDLNNRLKEVNKVHIL